MPKRKLTERLRRNLHPHEVQDALQERFKAADEIDLLREALRRCKLASTTGSLTTTGLANALAQVKDIANAALKQE